MTRILAIAAALLFVGCATPNLATSDLDVVELTYGLYLRDATGSLEHVRTTTDPPCDLGTVFGAEVQLLFSAGYRVALPIIGTWVAPPHTSGASNSTDFLPQPFVVERGEYNLGIESVNILEAESDQVSGEHVLRFRDPESGHVYYERTFFLSGCPGETG